MSEHKAPPPGQRNCTRGDWAVCIGKVNRGRVVRCVKWVGRVPGWMHADRWLLDQEFRGVKDTTKTTMTYPDHRLKPLRGTFDEVVAQVVAMRLEQ